MLLLVLCTLALSTLACPVTVSPCSPGWKNGQNQTFAFLGVGQPNFVQIYSYWGNDNGCLSGADVAKNATNLSLTKATCSEKPSVWTYGPGTIKDYVFYNNTEGMCLTLVPNATAPLQPHLTLMPCCYHSKTACTLAQTDAQLWLEPVTSSNPYSIIASKYAEQTTTFCLTRIGTQC